MTEIKVSYITHAGNDLSVVNSARVSFAKQSDWGETYEPDFGVTRKDSLREQDSKLIRFLASHNHISPFHHTFITLHVKAPLFVARQLVKHEYMPWNEVSRRYVDDEPEFYKPVWRSRASDKKQGSGLEFTPVDQMAIDTEVDNDNGLAKYNYLLEAGVAPEQARSVLSQNLMTEWYWSGTLSAWAKMYNLRAKEDTQYETQLVAKQAGATIKPLFPVSWGALTQ